MSQPTSSSSSEHYRAIVDMGSNGIRFSITDLSPSTSRILPTVYSDRAGISLYDAQWATGSKALIPNDTMDAAIRSLLQFKRTCEDFGVRDEHVRILATEATRQATNSEEYREKIRQATGWTVEMLPKEDEGRVGANGVVSSFSSCKGLMMDLGGGSTQITWLCAEKGDVRMSDAGSVSMPYGAAALIRRLNEANAAAGHAVRDLRDEITAALKEAVKTIDIPQEIWDTAHAPDGMTLYLSGGGFRGWGFLLMSQHPVSPYPIPIINGFKASMASFENTSLMTTTAASEEDIFRVSERRASQVPAVAFLVTCMLEALPVVRTVRFAQGGVREGSLYMNLPSDVKAEYPLVTGTNPLTTPWTSSLLKLLTSAIPPQRCPLPAPLITAFAQALYVHNSLHKDLKAAAALRSTTTGALASIHGASHDERAAMAIMLCERWGGLGDLPPGEASFYHRLLALLGPEWGWWCIFFGRVGAVLGAVFPAGVVRDASALRLSSGWIEKDANTEAGLKNDGGHDDEKKHDKKDKKDKDKKEKKDKKHGKHSSSASDASVTTTASKSPKQKLNLVFDFTQGAMDANLASDAVTKALQHLSKLGKKKNWPERGYGFKIEVQVLDGGGNNDGEGAGDSGVEA